MIIKNFIINFTKIINNTFISYPLLMKNTIRIIAYYNWNLINCYLIDWKYYKLDKNNKTKLLDSKKVKKITIY